MSVKPEKHFIHWQQDSYGNFIARVTFTEPTREMDITVDLLADMTVINPFEFFVEDWANHFPFDYPDMLKVGLAPFLETETAGILMKDWLSLFKKHLPADINMTDFLVYVNQKVYLQVSYLIRMEVGVQTCEETLAKKSGSCRDSA